MEYHFISMNLILLYSNSLMDMLHDYGLLHSKLTKDAKKIITYYVIQQVNNIIKNKANIIYYDHSIWKHNPLLSFYDERELNNFIYRLCAKIKKVTRRLIIIPANKPIPTRAKLQEVDGVIIDELVLLNNQKPPHAKQLLKFLQEYNLQDLFNSMSTHI